MSRNSSIRQNVLSNRPGGYTLCYTQYDSFQYPSHFHDYYVFQLVKYGHNLGFTERISYVTDDQSILVINPVDLHAGKSVDQKPLDYFSLKVQPEFIQSINKQLTNSESQVVFQRNPVCDPTARNLFHLMLQFSNAPHMFEKSILNFLRFMIKYYSRPSESSKVPHYGIQSAVNYLECNYHRKVTLKELAETSRMSLYHFNRSFKKQVGLTPFAYLRNIRIEKSKPLLQKNKLTEVANSVGFFDQSHFIRNFKYLEGLTPSQMVCH